MNTIYFGGCWSTNIGNAFIDLGALQLTSKYNPLFYSELSKFYFDNRDNYFESFQDFKPKCAFFSGMVTCIDFIKDQGKLCDKLTKLNIPIIFNGVGGSLYNQKEITAFSSFIKNHNVKGFISRDNRTYDDYCNVVPLSFRGVDCGFFIPDKPEFNGIGDDKKYFVYNFETSLSGYPPEQWGYNKNNENHIICHHQTLSGSLGRYTPGEHISRPRTMIAELPHEYIYLYAKAKETRSNRVHACVATLAFGGAATLIQKTDRASLFDVVGCGELRNKLVTADINKLNNAKNDHVQALDTIMNSL